MTPEMQFECLLICHEPKVYGIVSKVLRDFSIAVEHCLTAERGCEALARGTHDLLLVDWQEDSCTALLKQIWKLSRKVKPTIVRISGDASSHWGGDLVLRKPITSWSATESLKAAYSRMLLNYRLHARFALYHRVEANDELGRQHQIIITDIGEGGFGLKVGGDVTIGNVLSFCTSLPEVEKPMHFKGRVVWTREYGTAGCELLDIPPVDRNILRDWLKSRVRVKKPLITV
jgi:PilZ domain-containing protein